MEALMFVHHEIMARKRNGNHIALLSMPEEILVLIASHTERRTLRSLRLVCTKLCKISTETFGKTQLRNRRFVFSLEGVLAFLELAAHPTLGRYLRNVEFSTFRLDLSLETLLKIGRQRLVRKISKRMGSEQHGSTKCSMLLKLYKIRKYTSDEAAGTQKKFPSRSIDAILKRAFNHLAANNEDGKRVSIGIYDDFARATMENICYRTYVERVYGHWSTAHQKGYGWNRLYGGLPHETWKHRPDIPLDYIERALQGSSLKPSLVLSLQAFTGVRWAVQRFFNQPDAGKYDEQSGRINSLLKNVLDTIADPHHAGKDVCVKDPRRMLKLHGRTACLEFRGLFAAAGKVSLLEVPIFPRHARWGAFRNLLIYPCLEELRIESCAIRANDLVDVLTSQKDKLKKVIISRTTLIFDYHSLTHGPVNHWEVMPVLFDAIQMFPQLELFSLDHVGLADADKRLKMIIGYDVFEEKWEGRQMIRDGAAACAASLRAEFNDIEDPDKERRRRRRNPTNAAFLSKWDEEGTLTPGPIMYDSTGLRIRPK